jgi:hypothetical protein
MKKTLLALCSLAFVSLSAIAGGPDLIPAAPVAAPDYFTGLYVGAGVGEMYNTYDLTSLTRVYQGAGNLFFTPVLESVAGRHSQNAMGTAYLGYGYTFQSFPWFNLSGEVYGSVGRPNITITGRAIGIDPTSVIANSTNIRLNSGEGGIDLRPGVLLAPRTLFYGRVGVSFNKFRVRSESFAAQTNIPAPFNGTLLYTNTHSVAGIRFGAGLEQMVFRNLSLRGDAVFTDYEGNERVRSSGVAPFAAPYSATHLYNTNVMKMHSYTFILSAAYHLGNLI